MPSFAEKLIALVNKEPGLTDRQLTEILKCKREQTAQVNQEARLLEKRGILVRRRREDGLTSMPPAMMSAG